MRHTTLCVDQEEAGLHGAFGLRFFGNERLRLLDGPAEGIEASLLVTAVFVPPSTKVDDPWIPALALPAGVLRRVLFFRCECPCNEQRIPAPETSHLGLQGVEVRRVGRCVPGPRASLLQSPITGRHLCGIGEGLVRREGTPGSSDGVGPRCCGCPGACRSASSVGAPTPFQPRSGA